MKPTAIAVVLMFLSGCAASYQTGEVTDKFSDPSKPRMIAMKGNAIDFGGPLIITRVSELNGFVASDRASGKMVYAGVTFAGVGRAPARDTWLWIRVGDEIVFLADNERIAARAIAANMDHQVTRGVGYSIDREYYDYADYRLTPDQFNRVANANTLEFQVSGRNGTETYPRPGFRMLDSFRANLQQFYQAEIAPHR